MIRYFLIFLFSYCTATDAQIIPVEGKNGVLEIGNWNTEWFGNTSYGPTNEILQQQNVLKILKSSEVDIWGLCEISDNVVWDSLLARLPQYSGVKSTWNQTQKTALLYKKELFNLHYSRHILHSKTADFANGRLPLEVALLFKNNAKYDTIYLYVIHLKANVGNLAEKKAAYTLRYNSSRHLQQYLDTFGMGKKWAIIGDWNDDLDTGILDSTASPFLNLLNDPNHYYFTTKKLTDNKEKSTVSYPNIIDHQCISPALKKTFLNDSCKVWKVDKYIAQYGSSTSDHYPIISKYSIALTSTNPLRKRNETSRLVYFNGIHFVPIHSLRGGSFEVYSITGKKLFEGNELNKFNTVSNQYYFIRCISANPTVVQKIFVP